MPYKIKSVTSQDNYIFEAVFYNGQIVSYDVKPLFKMFTAFKMLEDNPELFQSVKVDMGGYGISWNDELDLDAKSIWDHGILLERTNPPSLNHLLAYQILLARQEENMTQKELAEKTGIYQAEISKLIIPMR